ncbi:DUF1877 family protein [Actinomadura gamaensis]|uniref:DUF1877 family protein n=1 Tax=Actinomadura gamaensis TaxID=1763541 RepID=A0ABV9TRQ7_9ACTN
MVEGEIDPARLVASSGAEDGRVLDLGGDWQVLHWLLTGDAWDGRQPEADVVCGGRLLTEDGADATGADVIYLAPERVKAAAAHLDATPFASLTGRLDADAMRSGGVQDADDPHAEERLRPAYARLTAFFRVAAGEGEAVVKLLRAP